MKATILAALVALALVGSAGAQSRQPPQEPPRAEHQTSTSQQRDTAQQASAPNQPAASSSANGAADKQHDAPSPSGLQPIDILTGFLVFFAFVQSVIAAAAGFTTYMQLRAYMTLGGLHVSPLEEGKKAQYWIEMRNTGNTPARQCAGGHVLVLSLVTDPLPDTLRGCIPERSSRRDIGAGTPTTYHAESDVLEPDQLALFDAGKAEMRLMGRCEYRDVFGISHWTDFCHVGRIAEGDEIKWWTAEKGNNAS